MEEAFLSFVKQAFHEANVCHDCEFRFETKSVVSAGLQGAQCIVTYESGNEYILLDKLIACLNKSGEIKLIEFRGRGRQEASQLLFEFKFENVPHQVIYLLPPN